MKAKKLAAFLAAALAVTSLNVTAFATDPDVIVNDSTGVTLAKGKNTATLTNSVGDAAITANADEEIVITLSSALDSATITIGGESATTDDNGATYKATAPAGGLTQLDVAITAPSNKSISVSSVAVNGATAVTPNDNTLYVDNTTYAVSGISSSKKVLKDDVVTITVSEAIEGAITANGVDVAFTGTTGTATLTADEAESLTIAVKGATGLAKITGVKVERAAAADTSDTSDTSDSSSSSGDPENPADGPVVLFEGSKAQGTDWAWNPATVDAAAFADAAEGDTITITFTCDGDAAYQQIKIADQTADTPNVLTSPAGVDETYGTVTVTGTTSLSFALNSADVALLKATGMAVSGYDITITKITLTSGSEDPGDDTSATTPAVTEAPNGGNFEVVTPNDTTAATTTAAPEVVTGANGESVEAPKDVIPSGATLEAKEQTKEEAVKAVEAVKATDANKEVVETVKKAIEDAKAAVMDINLVKDGVKVQPNGTIKVTVKVPEALKSAANLFVYRVEDNGTFTDVKATVKDGKIEFTTSHFSTYIITSEALTGDAVVTEAAATTPAATTADGNTTTDDKNQATGVVLAVIPAMLAAAGVIAAKKRK